VGDAIADAHCQLPIYKTKPKTNPTMATEGMKKSAIENQQLAIAWPTCYRKVVLTSFRCNVNDWVQPFLGRESPVYSSENNGFAQKSSPL